MNKHLLDFEIDSLAQDYGPFLVCPLCRAELDCDKLAPTLGELLTKANVHLRLCPTFAVGFGE